MNGEEENSFYNSDFRIPQLSIPIGQMKPERIERFKYLLEVGNLPLTPNNMSARTIR